MHFPLFQISPYFQKYFRLCGQFSKFYFFPKNFSIFIRQNFWWSFLAIDHKFRISPPTFPVSVHFPFAKIIICPFFNKFVPLFSKNSPAFYILYVYFVSSPTLTMMHLCITQCTYWTPLNISEEGLFIEFGSIFSQFRLFGEFSSGFERVKLPLNTQASSSHS